MISRTITNEEIATYRESGFVKVDGILGADELDRLSIVLRKLGPCWCLPVPTGVPGSTAKAA